MTDLNYEEDMQIDPEALDVESLRQAPLFYKYSRNEAKAKKDFDLAWENVKVIRSQLIKQAADDKSLSNAAKLEAFYRDHPEHVAAKQALIEAEYEYNMASAATKAMYAKKGAIESLIKLALADYFARPSEPRDIRKEVDAAEAKTKAAGERAAEKMTTRRKRK